MIVDQETFTEIVIHLKLASDAVLKTARALAVISHTRPDVDIENLLDAMLEINKEITFLERVLRAVIKADRDDTLSETKLH